MRWNIFQRFFIPIFSMFIVGTGIITYVAYTSGRSALHDAITNEMTQTSERLAAHIEDWTRKLQLDIIQQSERNITRDALVHPDDWQAIQEANQALKTIQDRYAYVVANIVNVDGLTIASSTLENVGKTRYDDRPYFQQSLAGTPVISSVLRSRTTGEPVIACSAPVRSDGQVIGVFLVSVSLSHITDRFISPIKIGTQGYAYMLDGDGTIIAHPQKERILEQKITDFDFGEALLAQKKGFFDYTWQGNPKEVYLTRIANTGWTIAVGADLQDMFAPIRRLRQTILLLALLMAGGISMILWLIVKTLTRPLVKGVEFAKAIAAGDIQAELDVNRKDEIGILATALREMKARIQEALQETGQLTHAIQTGMLSARGRASQFQGCWQDLILGINRTIDAFMEPFQVTADCIKRIAKGDIPAPLNHQYEGDFNDIQQHINLLIEAMNDISSIAEQIANGNLTISAKERSEQDRLMKALNRMITALNEVVEMAEEIAAGNLTVDIQERSANDRLMIALNSMVKRLHEIVYSVMESARNVAEGSEQMNLSAQDVAEGANHQSVAAEQASASMEQMAANIKQNADNARQTEKIALQAAHHARISGEAVAKTVQAMQQIAKKIAVIEEIAGETRLLSLNATIEAAKAQEYGKGFAVVASEVRTLARRSHEAAEEINELVRSSVKVSNTAGKMLKHLVPNIQKTTDLVVEITAASNEQSTGTEMINNAIQQLDQVIQQNTATAEEMATMAEELTSQARQLQSAMTFFKVKDIHWDDEKPLKTQEKQASPPGGDNGHKQLPQHFSENLLESDEFDAQFECYC